MSLLPSLLDPKIVAAGRTAVGASMLVRPTSLPILLGATPEAAASTTWVVQMLGAREVALGAGALLAGGPAWAAAGVLCDAVDAAALAAAVQAGTVGRRTGGVVVAVAALAALAGLPGLRRRPPRTA